MPKILIVYAYFETPDSRRNLGYFCRHGITPHEERQHVVVINGACSIEDQIPKLGNVKVIRRENRGFDFGAWAHAFRHVQLDQFDYFILLNSSVTGPFLPSYQDASRWPELFTSLLNDRVKLAGITINVFRGDPIVQSMLLATDRVGFDLLSKSGIFTGNDNDATKEAVIYGREIPSSLVVMKAGFLLDCLATTHSQRTTTALKRNTMGDIIVPRGYLAGYTLEPYDLCFFKTNRECSGGVLERSMRLADDKLRGVSGRRPDAHLSELGPAQLLLQSTMPKMSAAKLLIIYAYHESATALRNLSFFLRHGVTPDRSREHVIVLNGACSIEDQIPRFENVRVLKRPNKGFDFGAWADALRRSRLDAFDYFFLLNGSVTGPFLPAYQDFSRWPDPFLASLNDQIKLAGLSIDVWDGSPIVHSMLLSTDRVGIDLLIRGGVFTGNDEDPNKETVVFTREVRASKIITERGFQVDSLDLVHGRRPFSVLQRESRGDGQGDVHRPGAYRGYTVEPFDLAFFKTNRGLSEQAVERGMKLADYKRATAADRCFQNDRIRRAVNRLKQVPSLWKSHVEFAVWITCRFLPHLVVDLGVDRGCSTYAWGISGVSSVVGIDRFKDDERSGTLANVAALGAELAGSYGYENTARILRSSFEGAADTFADKTIDVLHIDGLHTKKVAKKDLKDWLPKLSKDGLVVLHGTRALPDTVGRRFEKLDYSKVELEHGGGIGVASRDERKIAAINKEWKQLLYYRASELRHREFDDLIIQP